MFKSKNFFEKLATHFLNSFKDLNWIKQADYKGIDLYGNCFFEAKYKNGRVRRFVESNGTLVNFDEWKSQISPEWESWLRYRRNDPPLEEELLQNEAIAYLKKQRSKELLKEEIKKYPKTKLNQDTTSSQIYSSFPIYEDLETSPGLFNSKIKPVVNDKINVKKDVQKLTDY